MLYLSLSLKMQTVVGYYVQCVMYVGVLSTMGICEGPKHPLRSSTKHGTIMHTYLFHLLAFF